MSKTRVCAVLLSVLGWAVSASAQVRVMHYNIAGCHGDMTAMKGVLAAAHADDKMGWAQPVDIFVFDECLLSARATIQAAINATAPSGVTYTFGTYTSASGEDSASGAEAIFYRSDRFTEITSAHADIFVQASRYADRWVLQLNGYSSPYAKLYIYCAHLKASTGSANAADRATGMAAIRADADALGAGVPVIYAGDFNLYNNGEAAYATMIAAGNAQGVDPLGNGNWTTATNAWKHTQAPSVASVNGMTGGGMDDRFDFLLPGLGAAGGQGVSALPSTYRAFGNDGNHYNLDINAGNNSYYPSNIARSNALADNLQIASDHIPNLMEFQIPAKMSASLVSPPVKVIRNAAVSIEVKVQNTAPYTVSTGVDPLAFAVSCTGGVSGSASGTAPLSPSSISKFVTLNTATVGTVTGNVSVTSSNKAVEPASTALPVSVQVVRPANPSFSASSAVTTTLLSMDTQADSGPATADASLRNYLYDSNQAKLDVNSVSFTGSVASRLSMPSGLGAGLATGARTLHFSFDTAGIAAGTYAATAVVHTSDESLPGSTAHDVTVNFDIAVGSGVFGDINGDGLVDGADLGLLLLYFGACDGCPADLDGDGQVDSADLGLLLLSYT
jgi:endonuclease/exonuclease/phosphatase family metal-dependent hydrolase